ncbi:microfibril-associated glycoprotein 4-like [Porites lutea]|uniref:microfibril-associated glycoprotein 4-like n=1 Tax=Porites lutea TaxID=51062 RepID=UPI003CC656EE
MIHFIAFVFFVSMLQSMDSITAQTQNQLGSKGTQQCTINNNFYAGPNKKVETVMFEMKKQLDEIQKELRNLTQKTKKTENKTKAIHYRKNCAEVYKSGDRISGVYTIDPDGSGAFDVYCDHSAPGGGWTVFQKRLDGSVDFSRGWNDYKLGFGNLNGEFWLGLDKIHRLTKSERCKLRVDLEDTAGKTAYAEYDMFAVTSERTKYQLGIGTYSGTAGDSLTYHRGHPFSTKDQDNDNWPKHCAEHFKGAWWHESCLTSNLNGPYRHGKFSSKTSYDGVVWYHWKGADYSLKRAEMKVRPEKF